MKKKKFNSFLALLLAATMAFGEPATAFAAELETASVEESESLEETTEVVTEDATEEAANGETEEVTSGETEEGTTDEAVTEEVATEETTVETQETEETTTVAETTEESVTEEVTTEEVATEEVATEETTVETQETEEVVAEEAELKTVEELGFKTMSLNPAMIEEKAELSQVVTAMSDMKSGEDYLENQVVYFAENEEIANQIAECYDGILVEYEYGVAVATIKVSVKEAISVAANTKIALPAVYPNIIYKINDGWIAVEEETEEEKLVDEADVEREEVAEENTGLILPCEDEHLYATTPNDTYFAKQWHHEVMNTVEAWNGSKGKDVKVAVIDSGVDYTHPDLAKNIVGHVSTCDEGDGRDDNGHGTHCAGIIAAVANNGKGISGIAPEASIFAIKALNSEGSGSTADIIEAVQCAINEKVDVISMSLGSPCWDALYQQIINNAASGGIVIVAAAGNDYDIQKNYPAAFNNVISVAATDYENVLTDFSNYGKWVDIAAPGENILSTLPTNFTISRVTYEATGYGYMSGTSMACPAVAGTVALMIGNCNDSLSVSKITKTLIDSAEPYGASSYWYGYNDPVLLQNGYDDPNLTYPLVDAEAATYAVDNEQVQTPKISFSGKLADKNVVEAGYDQYFELTTDTKHAKIYYTLNGKKPTAKTGNLYTGKIRMDYSGKVKIQAIAVVGNKTSKVLSETYKFDVKAQSLSSSCNEEMTVAIGKSIQLSVDFTPYNTSNQKLEWICDDGGEGLIKVDKKGKVSCSSKAKEGHTATITAKTTDDSKLEYEFKVKAVSGKVEKVQLKQSEVYMSYWADKMAMSDIDCKNYVSTFKIEVIKSGTTTDQYLYKSSNPNVASVDAYGNVTALGKGKATITVTANDGSGKKAKCKVTVKTPVFDIYMWSSTGYSEYSDYIPIGTGCSIKMNTEVNFNSSYYLYKPTNKKLEWKSSNPAVAEVKNGKVTCKSDATPGTYFTITAIADDKFGTTKTVTFKVTDKITKMVYVDPDDGPTRKSSVGFKGKVGSGIYDLLYTKSDNGWIGLYTAHDSSNFCNDFSIKVSNRDVVYRYYNYYIGNWIVIATKPGNSKVTYTARDGSNTKFTLNYKVIK